MNDLAGHVHHWLAANGHVLCAQSDRARAVELRPVGSVWLADLQFASNTKRLIVKAIAADANVQDAADLMRIHAEVRRRSEALACCTPAFLGCEPERKLIAMEYAPGPTLRDVLWRTLWLPGWRETHCRELLARAADVLSAFNQFAAADFGVPFPHRPNACFLEDIEEGWTDPRIRKYLPDHLRDPEQFYRVLPAGFLERTRANLVPVDAQLKNTLVAAPGKVCFIDLDYLGGNPAISLAHFLVSLDRLGLRHPLAWRSNRLAGWKQHFLDQYARHSPEIAAEVVFFYPRVLMQAIRGHVSYRPRSGWYLLRYYGARLRSFLQHLEMGAVATSSLFLAALP